jgi:hypothetical protein
VGVGAECWACVMHVSCAVSPCVDCGACTVVQLCHLSVCCVACCLLCRLWVHALRCLIYIYFFDIGCGARNPTLRSAEQLRITQLRVTEAYKRQGVARVLINRNGRGASGKQKRAHKAAAELRWNALEAARRHSEPDGMTFCTSTGVVIFIPNSATHLQSDDLDWDWA